MLALINHPPPRLVRDHPRPKRGPGEARIRVRLAGICDTDLQLAQGYMHYRGVLGHEFVGEVIEADDRCWLGRRVVSDINAGCGACAECLERDGHHCQARTVVGIVGRDGALAEELVIPERCLVAVPDAVADEAAVFSEPLAAALHVLDEISTRAPIAVIGDGKLGLLVARALGAAGHELMLIGHHPEKLALARAVGTTSVLESELDPEKTRFSLVVEASGSGSGLALALALTEPRGTVILKTTVAGSIAVDLSPIVINELSVVGSRCGNLARAISALESKQMDPTPLIAARYPLDRADLALEHAARKGTLKVLVEGARG